MIGKLETNGTRHVRPVTEIPIFTFILAGRECKYNQ
jgi:hypothetical protein